MSDWYSRAREEDGRTDDEVMSEIRLNRDSPLVCNVQEDNVRGDIGGPCTKPAGHDGDHDPFFITRALDRAVIQAVLTGDNANSWAPVARALSDADTAQSPRPVEDHTK